MKLHFIPKIFKGIIIFLLVFKIETAFSQTPELIRYTSDIHNFITCMIEKDNFIWIGTWNDGIRKINTETGEIEVLREDSSSLKGNFISHIIDDKKGKIWISAGTVLNVYDGKDWIYYDSTNSPLHYLIHSMALDSTGKIWITSYPNELSSFDGNEWKSYDILKNTKYNTGKVIQADQTGNIWILSEVNGLEKFDGIKTTRYDTLKTFLPYFGSSIMAFDKNNNLWISGNDEELIKFDGINWTLLHSPGDDLNYYISSILFDIQNNLIITNRNGIKKFNGTNWSVIDRKNSKLSDNNVYRMLIDKHLNYWLGTASDGLIKYTNGEFIPINLKLKGLDQFYIRSLKVDSKNRKFIIGDYGICVLDADIWDIFNKDNSNFPDISNNYHNAGFDDEGNIWMDNNTGNIFRFNDSIIENMGDKYPDLQSSSVYDIFNHNNGYLYIRNEKGLLRFKNNICEKVISWKDFKYNYTIDNEGTLWTDSLGSIGYYDGEKWVYDLTKTIQDFYYEFSNIAIDSKGNKWVNTEHALLKFDGENWNKYICPLVQTPNDYAWKMTIDKKDNVWLVSQKGDLVKFDGINWKVKQKLIITAGDLQQIHSLQADTLNNIWIATRDKGVFAYREGGVDLTSVENPNVNELNLIMVYPNPSKNIINLGSSVITGEKYIISDISGRQVQTGIVESNELNISNLSKGAYYIMIMSQTGKQTVKFMKE